MKTVVTFRPRSAVGFMRISTVALAAVIGLGLALAGFSSTPAYAVEIDKGWLMGRLDTTISVGASIRLQQQDPDLIGVENGGRANSINGDNGNLNYDRGDLTSANIRVTHELDLSAGNFGFFGRMYYFYDWVIMTMDTERTELSSSAERYAGRNIKIMDAFLTGDFGPVSLRLGNQVLNWGESLFIQNGINAINPIDVSQLRVAGAELRDALMPVPIISLSSDITNNLSIEVFNQFYWNNTEIEPEGTFFATKDHAGPGSEYVFLGFGVVGVSDNPAAPVGSNPPSGVWVMREPDQEPHNPARQGGVAMRYFAEWLNDTEFGLYYIHYHCRLPLLSGRTGDPPPTGLTDYLSWALSSGDYASTAGYFREFPEDIDMFGASFSTDIGPLGLAVNGEVSFRPNQPLQVDDVELLLAALSPMENAMDLGFVNLLYLVKYADADPDIGLFSQSQLINDGNPLGYNEYVKGYRRKDVLQPQLTLTKMFGPKFGWDQLVVLGEIGATWILDMEDKDELRYEASGTYTSANDYFTNFGLTGAEAENIETRVQPATQAMRDFANRFSWGYRVAARADFNNAIGAINLQPAVAFYHDVEGTTPTPITNFVDDRKTISGSLTANYLNTIRVKLTYTNYFDGGDFHLLEDRDFASLTVSYSF